MDYNGQKELPSCALATRDQNIQRQQPTSSCRLFSSTYCTVDPCSRQWSTPRNITSVHLHHFRTRTSLLEQALRRRRHPTYAQRRAANLRERRRMVNLKEAFKDLRDCIPTFSYERKLSRIETLRLAIMYITFLKELVKGKNPEEITLNSTTVTSTRKNDQNVKWTANTKAVQMENECVSTSVSNCC